MAAPMTYPQYAQRTQPAGGERIAYGPGPQQFAELWTPAGAGPFPVVVMIHGGCWTGAVADRTIMNGLSRDLAGRGIAVWNIEYRGVDQPGGGYPGTFQDVGAAIDALRGVAARRLDLSRVVAIGHSAGGHLALWAAARRPGASGVRQAADPLRLKAVVSLAGLPDLATHRAAPQSHGCGAEPIAALVGEPSPGRADVYADTSPAAMLPLGVRQVHIYGGKDVVAPEAIGRDFQARAKAAGDDTDLIVLPEDGHFELIAPETAAWGMIVERIEGEQRR